MSSTTAAATPPSITSETVVKSQLEHLDDTDQYANAWSDAVQAAKEATNKKKLHWGGRGQGGRGRSRRTYQDTHVSVEDVRLEYVGGGSAATGGGLNARILLENATLKLQMGHVYALVGPNGCGKSSLLRRLAAGRIPGVPPQISTLYISQEDSFPTPEEVVHSESSSSSVSAINWIVSRYQQYCKNTLDVAGKAHVEELEAEMDGLDLEGEDSDQASKRMEELADAISSIEDELTENSKEASSEVKAQVEQALEFMGIDRWTANMLPVSRLTEGQQKKVCLALALTACMTASCDILLLDEPTNSLDVPGLLRLRQLVETVLRTHDGRRRSTTVVFVSHDCDFINDIATDVIEFTPLLTLRYYAGNYVDYLVQRENEDRHLERQAVALDKKRDAMKQTLQNLKAQPTPKRRGGAKKKARQITSHKKKMDRELGTNEKGPAYQIATSTIIKRKKADNEPDKSVQFQFRNCSSQWNEPLILAMDVGHTFGLRDQAEEDENRNCPVSDDDFPLIIKKEGYLFDCIDLCIEEGGTYNILGENASGKSTLLKILAKQIQPTEGKIVHALNVDVAFLDQEHVHSVLQKNGSGDGRQTALSYLTKKFPQKTEQDIRGECTAFGLSPRQIATELLFLSGGERCRLCLTEAMLRNPQVLCLDTPTANLDVESVEALIFGLQRWNGTVVMVSHDAHFLRALEAKCFVLVPAEGKLRRLEGGVDAYLRSFGKRPAR